MMPDVLIFSGCAGSGKGTVLALAREKEPRLRLSVSMTTRAPRPGEVNGREYTFVTREDFEKTLAEDGFLEHAEYSGNCYGTPIKQFTDMAKAGYTPVLEIETLGAEQAMAKLDNYLSVFLCVPDFATLEARLRGRGTETEEQIQKRLAKVRFEVPRAGLYQFIILNRDNEADAAAGAILDLLHTGRTDSPALVRDVDGFIKDFFSSDKR